jgi:hypothetical protein
MFRPSRSLFQEAGMHKEYYIVRRASQWQIVSAGTSAGPYISREVAERAAINLAKADFKNLQHAKVYVEGGLAGGFTVLYDSTADH